MINSDFFQSPPVLGNSFDQDDWLKMFLQWTLPQEVYSSLEPDLQNFGQRAVSDILLLGQQAESRPPRHIPFDAWGRRVDEIEVSEAWRELHRISAREGLIAIGYERRQGEYSRLYQFAKLHMFHPSSAFYSCPLAMADGAARVLELNQAQDFVAEPLAHLTSRDPQKFWTSGQWMTEKTGGSDVSGTRTWAQRLEGGDFALHGVKWFSSSTTSEMALGLARIEGAVEGSRGLSLFYIPVRRADGNLNGIRVERLKDKLGTKALPTAELTLQAARARLLGAEGQGVKGIATMLNITRLYNSISSTGQMRRALALVESYSQQRQVFGRRLSEQPLHIETMAAEKVKYVRSLLLTLHLVHLLGKEEVGSASPEDKVILRALTPVTKLYTAKMAMAVVSEMLECFGGAGYVEDTHIPVLLRDAQVFSIWEGATNVLSLDLLRVLGKVESTQVLLQALGQRIELAQTKGAFPAQAQVLHREFEALSQFILRAPQEGEAFVQTAARSLAFSVADIYSSLLLLEMSEWGLKHKPHFPWTSYVERMLGPGLCQAICPGQEHRQHSQNIVG